MATHYLEQWIALTGLHQHEVGDKAGYERTHFNKIVKGWVKLNRDKARNIAEALSDILGYLVNPADLFRPPMPKGVIDGSTPVPQASPAMGKEDDMLRIARPLIATLVSQLGLEVVIREAVSADDRMRARPTGTDPDPQNRPRR